MEWYYWLVIVVVIYFVLKKVYELFRKRNKERRYRIRLDKAWEKKRIKDIEIKREKNKYFFDKYKNHEIVDNIMNGHLWLEGTGEQILDSLGKPLDVDSKVTKTKRKETWKYNKVGKNRYNLKIYFENGFVVGWDENKQLS